MILILNNLSKDIQLLREMLSSLGVAYEVFDNTTKFSEILSKDYSGVILSGGPLDIEHKIFMDDLRDDLGVLLDFTVPILGICLGHQIIAEAYGGTIDPMPEFSKGPNRIILETEDPLFKGLSNEITVGEAHYNQVTVLPNSRIRDLRRNQ